MDITFGPLTSAALGLEPVVLVRVLGHGGGGGRGRVWDQVGPWVPFMSHPLVPRVMSEEPAPSEPSSYRTF